MLVLAKISDLNGRVIIQILQQGSQTSSTRKLQLLTLIWYY